MKITFSIQGMHCTSCAMQIDGALEELAGVQEANTSYARSQTEVTFDPAHVAEEQLLQAIRTAGYDATTAR